MSFKRYVSPSENTKEETKGLAVSSIACSKSNDEACREALNHVREDMRDLVSYDDLWNLVLWLDRKVDYIRNESVSTLTHIALGALKQLKNKL